ncbi:MAG: ATP-binding protein [Ferruginibacter sp.]
MAITMILSAKNLFAQQSSFQNIFNHKKDSLVKELSKHPLPDTARASALCRLIDAAIFLKERKELMPYWEEAYKLSVKFKYAAALVHCLNWKASFYKSEQKIDSAFLCLDSATKIKGDSADARLKDAKAFSFFLRGMIYENQENYYTALNNYFEAIKNYGPTHAYVRQVTHIRIAEIYEGLNNDDLALQHYHEAAEVHAFNSDDQIYTAIATIYYNRNDLVKAKSFLGLIDKIMPDTLETIVTGRYYQLKGDIALKEKKTDSSFFFFKDALKYYNLTRQMHADVIANICADIMRLKMESGDMNEAKKYADETMAAAKESHHKNTMANALTAMAAYYNKTGNHTNAYDALHQATILNDSVLTESNVKQANTLAAIYENDKKEKAINTLETEKKIQAASVKQKRLLNIIFLIIIAALVFSTLMLYRNFKIKQKFEQQKIAELEKEKQLMAAEGILKGQEDERSRLAKDLHDGLGGMLSGVKISFSNMKENMIMDAAHAATFEKSLAQLDSTIEELRKVAHNLMPEALVRFGLKSAVQDFCNSMQTSGNTKIICEQFGTERELGNIGDVNVYRIIQEFINNAVVHGAAAQIIVQLTKTPDKVLITVEDNGKGFDLNTLEKSPGIGLSNIKHRVNYFNGKMEIDSKPAEGTTVNIELIV